MKWKFLLLIVTMLLSTIFVGCGDQNSNSTDTKNKKVVVGLDDKFPPFGFRDDDGNIVGFDVDLAKETMRRLGREVEFKPIEWDNKEEELRSGNIDMIWNGLEVTDEREEYMLFSKPYMYSGFIIFVRHSQDEINTKSALAGLTLGIQSDSTAEMYVDHDKEIKTNIRGLELYKDSEQLFKDLMEGKIDAIIADETHGRYYIANKHLEDKIDALDIPVGAKGKIAIGFRKTDIEFFNDVQKTFDEVKEDGTAEKISKQWFGKNLLIHRH